MSRKLIIPGVFLVLLFAFGCNQEKRAETTTQTVQAQRSSETMESNVLSIPVETITGDSITLAEMDASALLVVNVASKCGYTPQYEGLEELYRQYKDSGLVVVGFPANDFRSQEPGTNAEILDFCQTNYGVTFPMMAKISVLGEDKHPLYVALTEHSPFPGDIEWNFNKFLLDGDGQIVARWPSKVTPMSDELVGKVELLLAGGA